MLDDYIALQKEGKTLPEIVGTLADKYNYDIKGAINQGKDQRQILTDLIKGNEDSGSLLSIPSALIAGGTRGLYSTTPKMLGEALQATGIPGVTTVGKGIRSVGEAVGKRFDYALPKYHGIPGAFEQAGEMMGPSLTATGVGALAGRAVGAAEGLSGAALEGRMLTGASLGGGTLFGASQGREAYEDALKAGLSKPKSMVNGIVQGLFEFGGEYLGTKYLGRLLGLGDKEVTGITKAVAKKFGISSEIAKFGMEALGVEAGTEVGQQFFEELTGKLLGASKRSTSDIVKDSLSVIPPTIIMTALTGGGGAVRGALNERLERIRAERNKGKGTATPEGGGGGAPNNLQVGPLDVGVSLVPTAIPTPSTLHATGWDENPNAPEPVEGPPQLPPPGGPGQLTEGTNLFNLPTHTENMFPPALAGEAGVPATLEQAPSETDVKQIKGGLNYLSNAFSSVKGNSTSRFNMLKTLIDKIPNLSENADFHTKRLTNQIHQKAEEAQKTIDVLEKEAKKPIAKKRSILAESLDAKVQDVLDSVPYMSKQQLKKTKSLLKAFSKTHEDVASLADNLPTKSLAYGYGIGEYLKSTIEAQAPEGYEPRKQIEAPPLPEIQSTLQDNAVSKAMSDAGIEKVDFGHPMMDFEEGQASKLKGNTLLLNPQAENFRGEILTHASEKAHQSLTKDERQAWEDTIKETSLRNMNPAAREAVKAGDIDAAYREAFKAQDKPWAQNLLARTQDLVDKREAEAKAAKEAEAAKAKAEAEEEAARPDLNAIHREIMDWEAAKQKAQEIYGKNKQGLLNIQQAANADALSKHIARKFNLSDAEARDTVGTFFARNIPIEGTPDISKYKRFKWAKNAMEFEANRPKGANANVGIITKDGTMFFGDIQKTTKKYVHLLDENGNTHRIAKEDIVKQKQITKEKYLPPAPNLALSTELTLNEPTITRKRTGKYTTIDQAIDAINYFLIDQHQGGKIAALKKAIRIMEEKFKLSQYAKKGVNEITQEMKDIKKALTFSGLDTAKTVNPVDTRIVGAISHIDNLLTDKDFLQKLMDVGTVIDTLTMGEDVYVPTRDAILGEMKSIRTYLDGFFTDIISSLTAVSEKGSALGRGFMIKDLADVEEGDFLTVLYSYTDGKNDPKYAMIQRRGDAPFIVPYSALRGDWVMSRGDLKAAQRDIRGSWDEIPNKNKADYGKIQRSALKKGNLQDVLENEFCLSRRFSQFFTGTAEKKAKAAGIVHEELGTKYVETTPKGKASVPNEDLNKRKRKARLDRLKKAKEKAKEGKSKTTYTSHVKPGEGGKGSAIKEILGEEGEEPKTPKNKSKASTNEATTSQSAIDEILDIQGDMGAYARLTGLEGDVPDMSDSLKSFAKKRLELYIKRILGDHVDINFGSAKELAAQFRLDGITADRVIDRLYRPQTEERRELLKALGLEELIAGKLHGMAMQWNLLVEWANINYSSIYVRSSDRSFAEAMHTSFHEIMEVLRHANYLSKQDMDILESEYGSANRPNEAIADAFSDYMMNEEGFINKNKGKNGLQRAFAKIKLFLKRIRNFLKGMGYRTSEDVFKEAAEGAYRVNHMPQSTEADFEERGKSIVDIQGDLESDPTMAFDPGIHTFKDYLHNIRNGIADTIKDKRLGKFATWIVPPQWQSHPVIRTIFGIVEDSSEQSWADISNLLEPVMPVLQDLKKTNKKDGRYDLLGKAIIASDKANVEFSDESLKEDFGLDDELAQNYHAVKEVYDSVLDKFFDSTEKTVLNITAKNFYSILSTDLMGQPTGMEDTISSLTQSFIDKSALNSITGMYDGLVNEYLADHEKISNFKRGEFKKQAINDYVKGLEGISDVLQPKVTEFVSEMYKAVEPLERQRSQYKDGFYFPRIRPAGDIAVKVMRPEMETDPDTGEETMVWREIDRFQTNPGTKTKQNVEKHKIITREARKYGENGFVFDNPEEFNQSKEDMLPSHVAIVTEPIIRTPNTFFEGVTNQSILTYLSYITTKIKETGGVDKEQFDGVLNTLHQKIDEDLKARSFARSRWIKRKGGQVDIEALLQGEDSSRVVGGYDTDVVNVTNSYTIAEMRNIARNEAVDTIHTFINQEDVKKEILGDANLYKWYSRYVDGVLSPDTPLMRYSRAVKSMISLWYLGGRVSSATIQMTQVWVTGGPELAIFENASKDDLLAYRGMQLPLKNVSEHLGRQGKAAGRLGKTLADMVSGKITPDERGALDIGIKNKVLQSQFINSLMARDEKLFGKVFTPVVNLGMKFFQYAEQKSREVGYLSAYRLAKEKGLSNEDALDFATNYTNTAFHIYSSTNKPLFATGKSGIAVTSSVPLALKGYQINYLGWLYKSFKNEYGKVYADKLIFSSVYMMALGGMWAIPVLSDLIDLLSSYMGIPLKKKIQRTITNNVTALKAMEFGLPAAFFGIDMSGSAKLDLLPREWSLSGVTDSLLGVWTSAGQKVGRTTQALETGQYLRAVESVAPVAVENAIKALRYGVGKEPMTTIYGRTVLDAKGRPIKPTVLESGLMLMGFRPVDLSQISSIYQATRTIENYWKVKHDRIFTKIKTAKDYQHLSNIISTDVNDYNQGISKYGGAIRPITADGIMRALKTAKGKPSRLAYYLEETY